MKISSGSFVNKTIKILLFFLFTTNTAFALYNPLMAIFITQHIAGATLATIGITVAIYALTKSVIQVTLAKRLDSRAGEKDDFFAILIGVILAIVYSFSFLFIREIWQLYFVEILMGIGDACAMAAFYAIFSHHIDRESEGFEWSLFSVGGLTTSTAVGGIFGAFIIQNYGFSSIFILAGILNIVGLVFILSLYPYIKILRRAKSIKQ